MREATETPVIAEVWFGMYRMEGETVWRWRHVKPVTGLYRGRLIVLNSLRNPGDIAEDEALTDRIMTALANGELG